MDIRKALLVKPLKELLTSQNKKGKPHVFMKKRSE